MNGTERERMASLDDETHLITFLIWFLPTAAQSLGMKAQITETPDD